MPLENLIAFFMLYPKPAAAISRLLDRGRLWLAIVLVLLVSILLGISRQVEEAKVFQDGASVALPGGTATQSESDDEPIVGSRVAPRPRTPVDVFENAISAATGASGGWFTPLAMLALALVPAVIALRAVTGFGSFGVLMRSEYMSLLMCTLYAWAAAYLPVALLQFAQPANADILCGIGALYFLALTALSLRTLSGSEFGAALGLATAGWVAAMLALVAFDFLGPLRYYLFSPFLLFYGYSLLRNDVSALGDGLRSRQSLRNQLEIATNNPRDADAHYQLGLIYQKRRQYSEAISRFEKAVAIDPEEGDAHLQLGRIALEQNRIDDAIRSLERSVAIDEKLSSSEGLRDLGTAYLKSGRLQEATSLLSKYADRRPYDPEGLFHLGKALSATGQTAQARERFTECIEAVKTAPPHRRAQIRKWSGEAQAALKGLS